MLAQRDLQLCEGNAHRQEIAQGLQCGDQVRAAQGQVAQGAVRRGLQLAAQAQAEFRYIAHAPGVFQHPQLLLAGEVGFIPGQQDVAGQAGALQ